MNYKNIFDNKKVVLGIYIAAFGLLFIRLRYGFDPTDESYYYATVKRFWQGDIPFITDWYPAQFSAVLLFPFYGLYTMLVPSGEGIILAGRYVFLLLQAIIALYSLWTFRKEKYALPLTILYLMCSRQNIPGLSYYTLYLSFCFIAVLSVYNYYHEDKKRSIFWILAGIGVSVATICMPFLALGVFVYGIYLLKNKQFKETLVFVLSILFCAALYLGFLFSRGTLPEYLEGLHYVMTNPDYTDPSKWDKILGTILSLGKVYVVLVPGFVYLFWRIISQAVKNKSKGPICFTGRDHLIFVLSLCLGVISFGIWKTGALYQQFTFLVLPYIIKAASNGKDSRKDAASTGIALYVAGLILALLFWMGSDTGASCLVMGFLFCVMGGVIVLSEETDSKMFLIIAVLLMISATSSRILGQFYRDAELWKLDTRIETGPAKGLFTEKSDAEDYACVIKSLDDVSEILAADGDTQKKILFTAFLPWGYLYTDCRNGSMTCWRTPLSSERLELYYEINPQQFPDVVFVLNEDISETNGLSGGERMNAYNPQKGALWEKISSYEHIDTEAGQVYILK